MVRRRTRTTTKVTNTLSTSNVINDELLPSALANVAATADQYFASPKRKDCKIDIGATTSDSNPTMLPTNCNMQGGEKLNKKCSKNKSPSPSKSKAERTGRIIGVPLATRSQTRTIEEFLNTAPKKNVKVKQESEEEKTFNTTTYTLPANGSAYYNASPSATNLSPRKEIMHDAIQCAVASPIKNRHSASNIQPVFICDLSEDTSNESEATTEYSDEAGNIINAIKFTTHRSSLRDSHSSTHSSSSAYSTTSAMTENIFLQEPVLTLNVDKSAANQASAIKINKSLEIEPIFSSPPKTLTAVNNALNGRFNQIVSLNITQYNRDTFGYDSKPPAMLFNTGNSNNIDAVLLPDNDNSSCDSGVVFVSSLDNSPSCTPEVNNAISALPNTSRRKPATPHRIVCPSPIKSAATRVASPATKAPITSPGGRKLAAAKEQLSPRKTPRAAKKANSKTRRRLNQQTEQMPYVCKTEDIKIEQLTTDVAMENGIVQTDQLKIEYDIELITCDDPNENEQEQKFDILNGANIRCGENLNNGHSTTKFILNYAKYPTAQENTTNNNNNNNNNNNKTSARSKTNAGNRTQQPKNKFQTAHPLGTANGNRELTEFFPVRRSVRKTKTAVKEEMMRNLELAILEDRADGLQIAHFEGKGRGIIAARHFVRGEFVVEYVGDLISVAEACEREKRYALDENAGCYMYYFKHKNQQYCIDATVDTGKLGRLVNHSRNGNLITKVVVVKQKPHLILIAKDDIMPNEELTYDYGDRSKESLLHHPWLAY